ncbi:MAG: hypothetical protein AB8B83_01215 [Bdellovibrionales bacterium]
MSKIVGTLFLVIVLGLIGGVAVLSFTDVPVPQDKITKTVSLEEFRASKGQ